MALAGHSRPEGEEVNPEVAAKVRNAVGSYVKQEANLKGGFFLRDSKNNEVRDLRFDYVHSGVGPAPGDQYRVCVDFLDQSKKRLDVDFYLKPTDWGGFEVSKIRIHKVDGVAQQEQD
jgi:hypothetical protein